MSEPRKYTKRVASMVGLSRTYHTVTLKPNGEIEVCIYTKSPVVTRVVDYYEHQHQEEIQNEIEEKIRISKLPKLPKHLKLAAGTIRSVSGTSSSSSEYTFVDEQIFCLECRKYAFKGYRMRNGDCICRDCRNLKRNPHPKPRIVYQNFEGGKRR